MDNQHDFTQARMWDYRASRLLIVVAMLLLAGCAASVPAATTSSPSAASTSDSPVAATTYSTPSNAADTSATPKATQVRQATTQPKNDEWTALRERPLKLPQGASGDACPVTTTPGTKVSPDAGVAVGTGPIYAVYGNGDAVPGTIHYGDARADNGWKYVKVLWTGGPDYMGPVLIRGRQLDGAQDLRFDQEPRSGPGSLELMFEADSGRQSSGWRAWPSYTRLAAPGCYAYQVDGQDFSYTIVFRAVDAPLPTPTPR